jgi:hypothetical protein
MQQDPSFERFLAFCKEVFERMEREGTWPWADSPNPEDLVESEDNPNDP